MDMARRRSGKGIGTDNASAEELLQLEDRLSVAGGERDAGELAVEAGQASQRTLETEAGSGGERAVLAANAAAISPFWSSRAQDEARLRAARPDFLGSAGEEVGVAQRSGASSSSTELRRVDSSVAGMTGPQGEPVSYGPGPRLQTTLDGDQPSRPQTTLENTADEAVPPGLSPREREVLFAMKEAMKRIVEQNQELVGTNLALQQRVERLEEERATSQAGWKSAEEAADLPEQHCPMSRGEGDSRDNREGSRSWGRDVGDDLGSMRYQQGFEQGYQAAKEMLQVPQAEGVAGISLEPTPPKPPQAPDVWPSTNTAVRARTPDNSRPQLGYVSTTPQGTPLPSEPPPRTPRAWHAEQGNVIEAVLPAPPVKGSPNFFSGSGWPNLGTASQNESVPVFPSYNERCC